jgi:hypothetical protein
MEAIGPLHLMIYLFKIMFFHCYVKVGEGRLASNMDHVHIMFDSDGSDELMISIKKMEFDDSWNSSMEYFCLLCQQYGGQNQKTLFGWYYPTLINKHNYGKSPCY